MKFAPGGIGPGFGDNFRPGVGPKEIAPRIGGGDFNPYRPPGLIAPPTTQASAQMPTGDPAPGMQASTTPPPVAPAASQPQGAPPQGQAGAVPANGQQMMMQRILNDPFLSRIFMQRTQGAGFGGSQYRQPFGAQMQPQMR